MLYSIDFVAENRFQQFKTTLYSMTVLDLTIIYKKMHMTN